MKSIDPQIFYQMISDVADLKGKMGLLIWFVGATMVPVWIGAITNLWKAAKVVKFLGGKEND